jgi:hypothetical protein
MRYAEPGADNMAADVTDIVPMLRVDDEDVESFTLTFFALDTAYDAGFFNVIEISKTLNVFGDEGETIKPRVARYRNFHIAQRNVMDRNSRR